jgi:hypothetical protein
MLILYTDDNFPSSENSENAITMSRFVKNDQKLCIAHSKIFTVCYKRPPYRLYRVINQKSEATNLFSLFYNIHVSSASKIDRIFTKIRTPEYVVDCTET